MPDSYTTRTLVGVLGGLDRPQLFLLDTFFPDLALFDTETVDFDKLDRMTGLAPFVSPLKPDAGRRPGRLGRKLHAGLCEAQE